MTKTKIERMLSNTIKVLRIIQVKLARELRRQDHVIAKTRQDTGNALDLMRQVLTAMGTLETEFHALASVLMEKRVVSEAELRREQHRLRAAARSLRKHPRKAQVRRRNRR